MWPNSYLTYFGIGLVVAAATAYRFPPSGEYRSPLPSRVAYSLVITVLWPFAALILFFDYCIRERSQGNK